MGPRILIVTSRLDVGGAERHLARIVPELKRRGFDVALYVMERGGSLESDLTAGGIPIDGPERKRVFHWPRAAFALSRHLRRERPTVVHFFLPRPYLYGSIGAELAGHRRRIMSRRSLADYRARYPLLGIAERWLHGRTEVLLGNSLAVIGQLTAEAGDGRKVGLIYNGVELPQPVNSERRQCIRRSLGLADETLVMAVVANLIAYKGHRDLIAALARIASSLPPWRLLVVGRDDGIGADLKRQAEAAQISSNILWFGERADVNDLLSASDIFVLPSHQEGFSNALLEAMAANIAPIATAVGGNPDAVIHNETGLLVSPHDPADLAQAILRLARDEPLRRRLANAARLRVQRYFSLEACIASYEMLYRALGKPISSPIHEILAARDGMNQNTTTAWAETAGS